MHILGIIYKLPWAGCRMSSLFLAALILRVSLVLG